MSTVNVRIQAFSEARSLGRVNDLLGQSLSRLSSGTRLTTANDPAAISSTGKYEAQNTRAQAASVNVQNAYSFVQSGTSFMDSMSELLTRMSELTQYAADGIKSTEDNALYQTEFSQLQDQLRLTIGGSTSEIGGTTDVTDPLGSFNGVALFGANPDGISVASSSQAGESIIIPETNLRVSPISDLFTQDGTGNYTFAVDSDDATQTITDALSELASQRSVLSGVGSRLEIAANTLSVESENISAALSRIQDVDVATESTRLAKLQILLESGTSMLAQANQSPESVLQLLKS